MTFEKLFIVLVTFCISFNASAMNAIMKEDTLAVSTPIFEIGNYKYNLPDSYFDIQPKPNCNAETALLLGTLPDFNPLNKSQRTQWGCTVGGKTVKVLLKADRQRREHVGNSIQYQFKSQTLFSEMAKANHAFYGFDEYYYPLNHPRKSRNNDILIMGSKENIKHILSCNVRGGSMNSTCSHYIPVNDLVVKISYSRTYLHQWKEIMQNVEHVLQLATIKKVSEHQSFCDQTFSFPDKLDSKGE